MARPDRHKPSVANDWAMWLVVVHPPSTWPGALLAMLEAHFPGDAARLRDIRRTPDDPAAAVDIGVLVGGVRREHGGQEQVAQEFPTLHAESI